MTAAAARGGASTLGAGDGGRVEYDCVVVGAGFAGLYALHRLRGIGLTTRLFEAGPGVGGVWFWNRYPGARCDVESVDYSYSFDDALQREWVWTDKYATQPEILKYLNHVADRFDLRRDIDLSTTLVAAEWDASAGRWLLRCSTAGGGKRAASARFLVMAAGCLSAPNIPQFPGMDRFAGETYHTGRWPEGGADFAGRKVAVIGTGSSGIQLIPLVAKEAARLHVLQRTAHFSIPVRNADYSPGFLRWVQDRYPALRAVQKMMPGGCCAYRIPRTITASATGATPEFRRAVFDLAWERGGLGFLYSFADIYLNKEANRLTAEYIHDRIRGTVRDPAVAQLLMPEYVFGCKRPCLDTGYYEAFNRPNVTLVDIRGAEVSFTPTGVRVGDGAAIDVDAVVIATGFDAMTGSLLRVDTRGEGGQTLKDKWADGPRSYLGLQVAGFPNYFTINGPGSPSVLTNNVSAIEQHVDWIADCIQYMQRHGAVEIVPTKEAEAAWAIHVEEVGRPNAISWGGCASWYNGANIPGKAKVLGPYAGGLHAPADGIPGHDYTSRCADIAAGGYPGFALRDARGAAVAPPLRRRALYPFRWAARRAVFVAAMLRRLHLIGAAVHPASPYPPLGSVQGVGQRLAAAVKMPSVLAAVLTVILALLLRWRGRFTIV